MFTLEEARAALVALRPAIAEFLVLRADLAELRADLQRASGEPPSLSLGSLDRLRRAGGANLADAKALEARLYGELERFASSGAHVKGYAPLLLDWPGVRDGSQVLWCWLEGEPEVAWYHRLDAGFAGRRPV